MAKKKAPAKHKAEPKHPKTAAAKKSASKKAAKKKAAAKKEPAYPVNSFPKMVYRGVDIQDPQNQRTVNDAAELELARSEGWRTQ